MSTTTQTIQANNNPPPETTTKPSQMMAPRLDDTRTSIPNEISLPNTKLSPKKSPPLTYQNTKTSQKYLTAKSQLAAGEFELALATIESAISANISILANDIHESLAPLYYLYGSTLLYDIEESSNPEEAMLAQQEEGTGDLQIAWENLEIARSITSKLHCDETMKMDLAQVHQRLGDLQRINGNYNEAVEDYKKCLNIRVESLGIFHRSVANCHYSLGLTYLMLAAEGDKETGEQKSTVATSEDGRTKIYRNSSLRHYLACGRSFSGLIAKLCGAEPKFVAGHEDEKPSVAGSNESPQASCSRILQQIRERVSCLKPVNQGDEADVCEWKEVLDEIQETIDSSEESLKVLKDVSKLKAKAESEVQEQDNSKETGQDKKSDDLKMVLGQSTIGFGSAKSTSANAFGHTVSNTSKISGPTNMLVAKKKRKDQSDSKLLSDKKIDSNVVAKKIKAAE